MDAPGWLSQLSADVPAGDEWLGDNERLVLARLHVAPRRASWRLGRWTAKAALAAWLGVPPSRVEVLAAADGAPQVWLDAAPAAVSLSLSHRGGRALAVVRDTPGTAGCDLEVVEPRSAAFISEWLAPAEQRLVAGRPRPERALLANLVWSAKEAAAKVRREGLRLDVRQAVVAVAAEEPGDGEWAPLRVDWAAYRPLLGWWRAEPGWVMVVAGDPATRPPRAL
jgi:4'-phosphopantetheinyl transferase